MSLPLSYKRVRLFFYSRSKAIYISFQQFFIMYYPESNLKYCSPLYIITEEEKKSIAAFCHGKLRLYL